MALIVLRHASAGRRSDWEGDDELRPLDVIGRQQATALARTLAARGPTRLVSSPATRCLQTLEPLGAQLGVAVEPDARLAEGAGHRGALALLRELGDASAVLCTHGDVLGDLLDRSTAKGGGWVVALDGAWARAIEAIPAP
ncbi:MAG: phosphoglycerate mutase family protein [Thermoleophilia bacterium]